MEIHGSPFVHNAQNLSGLHRTRGTETPTPLVQRSAQQDEVQFSDAGMKLSEAIRSESSSAGIRFDLVNRVKAEIAAGTYDTPDKMDIAVDRMLNRLS